MMELDRHSVERNEIYKKYGVNFTYKDRGERGRYKQSMQREGKLHDNY